MRGKGGGLYVMLLLQLISLFFIDDVAVVIISNLLKMWDPEPFYARVYQSQISGVPGIVPIWKITLFIAREK